MNKSAVVQPPNTASFLPNAQSILQRKCACGNKTVADEECAECRKKKNVLQRKLTIGSSNDPLEREADQVAEHVVASANSVVRGVTPSIQRYTGQSLEQSEEVPGSVDRVLGCSGRPMDRSLRKDMESRFDHDFSQVRVHFGDVAEQSARELNARAYTIGSNIVFGAGQFTPGTHEGRRLLAHELTHVVQQSGNLSFKIQRQPDDEKEPSSEIGKEIKKNSLFQKLPKFAQDKILDEIDNAPETITKAVLDKIIDLAPIDQQYKDGLKKAGEAIIKTVTGKKTASTSKCDVVPGYHEGTSSTYKGMCCKGSIESAMACCPKDKFAPNNGLLNCCNADEFVNSEGKCEKQTSFDVSTICMPPGKKDSLGKCCMPPREVINGLCVNPPKPAPPVQSFGLKFTIGVIDDYDIDKSVINSRQKPHFDEVKYQIHRFIEACPASIITITGFADKPGTEEHNMDLGQRRADYVKLLLQLDLLKLKTGGLSPTIFSRSEGENNPVDTKAGEKFSARNRRVEIEFNSICPPLGSPSLTKPLSNTPLRLGLPQKFNIGNL